MARAPSSADAGSGGRALRISIGGGEVSALDWRPEGARALLVLAHGAGAGMRHPFMEQMSAGLAARGVATLRYQFPYIEIGSRRPDARPVLVATVRAAIGEAMRLAPDLPLFAGGKSLGGRMTSWFATEPAGAAVRGLVFLGFPLHPAGQPATRRADHLDQVPLPMLFAQGTRDALADLDLLRSVVARLGAHSTLHVVEHADHAFEVLKRSGRSHGDVLTELCDTVAAWIEARRA